MSVSSNGDDWVEELQRKVFEECIAEAASNDGTSTSRSSSLSELDDPCCKTVPISVIINSIHRSFAHVPHFRKSQRTDFLEELRRSLQRRARDGERVGWLDFRDSSELWFLDLVNAVRLQDSNNNNGDSGNGSAHLAKQGDAPTSTEASDKDGLSTTEHSCCSDTVDDEEEEDGDELSNSANQTDAMATCFSLNSSSMGLGMTDSMIEYSDETDHVEQDITVDLQIRMRRYNEETANLKAELLRAEETISTLEADVKSKEVNLERISTKYTKLQREIEDLREMLTKSEKQEETCRQEFRGLEKAFNALQKKFEESEKKKEDVAKLSARIDELSKLNLEYIKQLKDYKVRYDEKKIECEYLQETYNELQISFSQLEQSHEKIIKQHLEKIEELQNLNNELQCKLNNSGDSCTSQLSITPPPYSSSHIHSTPYNSKRLSRHDSLYAELKATGYNVDEAKIQDLKAELDFYNGEIASLSDQIDGALQDIAASRNQLFAPSVQLVEINGIQSLKHKVTTLLNLIKTCPAVKEPRAPLMGEASREKPDVLPQPKKGSYVFSERDFASDKENNDLLAPPKIILNGYRNRAANPPYLFDISGICKLDVTNDETNNDKNDEEPDEVIVVREEVLKKLVALNETDPATDGLPPTNHKHKSIFTTVTKRPSLSSLVADPQALGDATYCVKPKRASVASRFSEDDAPCTPKSDMKTLKDDTSRELESSGCPSSTPIPKLDTRYVTLRRPSDKTYLVEPSSMLSSGAVGKSELLLQQSSFDDVRSVIPSCRTPATASPAKPGPKRKLSVYHRSFDVDSLQTPDLHVQSVINGEKKRSISTPDPLQKLTTESLKAAAKDQLTSYRCANLSLELSDSSSSRFEDSADNALDDSASPIKDEERQQQQQKQPALARATGGKPIIAPTRFTLSTVGSELELTPMVGRGIIRRPSTPEASPEPEVAQQSTIISSSDRDLVGKEENGARDEAPTMTVDASTTNSFKLELESTDVVGDSTAEDQRQDASHVLRVIGDEDNNDDDDESTRKTAATAVAAATAEASREIGGALADQPITARSSSAPPSAPTVGRAMSSGEDSSAESECDHVRKIKAAAAAAAKTDAEIVAAPGPTSEPTQPVIESGGLSERQPDGEDPGPAEDKVKPPPIMNGDGKEMSNGSKVTPSPSPTPDVLDEDESLKAFPSWTDEKLQESGIGSFPDMDSELNEILNEEQLRKKCINFSIGLSADRMTLSKRMELAVRKRDQAEQNFSNEVNKMQQDIKELAPLCVDSESLERVERVKTQLEMVSRCAHWVSCSAETLGAVRQERRVSRAVLLADKYLQTLRSKCEKLANELAETKRILAENNIVLEENLSEMGDDVPRVRYRAVPSNNRTMMARRRASIATISRPLLGSNQDISKEAPRQRNSVSGRAPGVRRPSLCFETPKWENDKLDRTDSTNSITELRDIFEQAESRRHSREENNNLIRTSVNNLSIITSEHTEEEEEVWSNPRDDIVPDLENNNNNNETNSIELRQHHRHPIICWLLARYLAWKPMLWGIIIAFLLGVFVTRVVSSKRNGPPLSWWSLEEILSQYVHVENARPRAI